MGIELKPGWYYLGMWFLDCPKQSADILACVFHKGDGIWNLVYRIRQIKDGKMWDSADKKEWKAATLKDNNTPEEEIERSVTQEVMEKFKEHFGGELTYLSIHGDYQEAIRQIGGQEFAHMRMFDRNNPQDMEELARMEMESDATEE